MGLIIWIIICYCLFSLPYGKIAKSLSEYVDLRYLFTGIVCMCVRYTSGVFDIPSDTENETAMHSAANAMDEVNHFLNTVNEPFGWIVFFAGIAMVIYSFYAVKKKRSNAEDVTGRE
ncbi:hypothetical protein [Pantoea agglomerans]|uniref:hypothetical protein n=1 Tax=Enterobacter agglomerans TaxID=549 RepID=UPI003208A280